jgi:penicillin-binding protein 1A
MNIAVYFRSFLLFLFFLVAFAAGGFFYLVHHKPIDFSILERYDSGTPTILLDDEGVEWARFQLEKREPITLQQVPPHLINAFIAAEDWAFFEHAGISWRGIIRSLLVNLYHGRYVQGASTITQQLVKLLFFNSKKTITRKIKEQLCAVLVEQQYTKEQILQTYLNHVYFGCGIYGVQAASQRFWGKDAQQLTVAQSALLASIVRSPAQYCPLICPFSAQKRRNVTLRSMHRLGHIDQQGYEQAKGEGLALVTRENDMVAPHLKETIRLFLEELIGKETLYGGGLVVKTTLNATVQRLAQQEFSAHMAKLKKTIVSDIDGSLISLDVKSGAIKALIGGYDFNASQFNRALQARRQIGSVFKPLIYAAAILQGKSLRDTDLDEPFELCMANGQVWAPKNFDLEFDGQVTLAYALYRSVNTVAIKTLLAVGYEPVIALARKCHLSGQCNLYPSLALGCVNGTLAEVAGMFNVFANNGVYVAPHYISWIKDRWGTKILRAHYPQTLAERVLEPRVSGQVTKVLTLALKRVRQWYPQKWVEGEAISKTGTTNDCRTCWYVAATPNLTTALYIGCDDNRSMGKNVFPFRTAFPIWMSFNRKVQAAQKESKGMQMIGDQQKFSYDPSLTEVLVNEKTGQETRADDPEAIAIFV